MVPGPVAKGALPGPIQGEAIIPAAGIAGPGANCQAL
jgi:hypothetical protein